MIQKAIKLYRRIPRKVIAVSYIIAVVVFLYFYLKGTDFSQLKSIKINWWYISIASLWALLFRYSMVYIWRVILRSLGTQKLPGFGIMAEVFAKAWISRYIPGTVTWIAGKIYMASQFGISKSRLAVSSLLEGGMQVVAAVVVSLLNPIVGTHDLASQLEAPHQPYNWLFILTDVLAGLAVSLIAVMQINKRHHALVKWCIISYGIFGILVALAALTPLNCNISADSCGPIMRNPSLIVHGGASILSVGFLFLSTVALGAAALRENTRLIKLLFALTISAWLFFGFGSLAELMLHDKGNGMQEYFITICSISILLVISFIEYQQTTEPATAEMSID